MRTANGFTLVELMIVIGIIGVVASFAMPIYAEYLKRGKVAESVQLLSAMKQPTIEFYFYHGHWPMAVASVGSKTVGAYTSIVTTGPTASNPEGLFFVEATMKGEQRDDSIEGNQLRMYYDATINDWFCSNDNVQDGDGSGTPIPPEFVPSICR